MTFNAFVLRKETLLEGQIEQWDLEELVEGNVLIKVAYSSVNYKDAMVVKQGNLAETSPLIPGIDLAGTVVHSKDNRFSEGQKVIATSYKIGTSHHGGYAEYARIPAEWVIPLPEGLTLKESMILGTAGLTAALSITKLEQNGLEPAGGKVVVPGATGGVGSLSVELLAKRGYHVVAGTNKVEAHDWLKQLGASEIVTREELEESEKLSIRQGEWAGAIDAVGGKTTSYLLTTLKRGGSIASSGLTGGVEVETTVLPFIGRGINWLGIDSVTCPMKERAHAWYRLATDLKPSFLEETVNEITLTQLNDVLTNVVKGSVKGRTIVQL
ncbi:acrylyl-CoA reductase family protein [Shouchella lehensis]|uniref:Quinone oxidoreductase n=1 Tax=Shouchella lehensis G1 TaxID=1246626 RepID=A0A060LSD5_9BACI|nr:acryloyl-CoA reductase [Shouchella lehensis]AIC92940.1 quinone oxidoreductase [Shouchella lehensis G1]